MKKPTEAQAPRAGWRTDLLVVVILTVCVAGLAMHYELSERYLAWAVRNEHNQVDELPGILLVLAALLVWFAWRRYRESRLETSRRHLAELNLEHALADNRRLARANVDDREHELRAIARELHDELGQTLNAIKLDAVTLRDHVTTDPLTAERARAIIHCTDHVHRVVSNMIRRLRPVGLDDLGLQAALEHCVDGWRQRLPRTTFIFEAPAELPPMSDDLNMSVYRIVQEALTNIAKHASATQVRIVLAVAPLDARPEVAIDILVSDNGVGFDPERPSAGLGLIGMRERTQSHGGRFEISTSPGAGMQLQARLPLGVAASELRAP
jgi:signal transduction histidine kinase